MALSFFTLNTHYRVYNLEECEFPQALLDKLPKIETHEHDPIEAADQIVAAMPNPPEIQYAGSKDLQQQHDRSRYDAAARSVRIAVEIGRDTSARVDAQNRPSQAARARGDIRRNCVRFRVYSKEELVAKMGAAYVCAEAGISNAFIANHVAYVTG